MQATPTTIRIGLSETAAPFLLDGRPAIFAERSQGIYQLNESAAAILGRLEQAVSLEQLYREIASQLPSGAEELDRLLIEWSEHGLVDVSIDPQQGEEPATVAFLPLEQHCVELRFAGNAAASDITRAYAHLPRTGNATMRATVHHFGNLGIVKVGDDPAAIVPVEQTGPALRLLLNQTLLASSQSVAIHGACLSMGGEAILLLGEPGAGKSTLARFAEQSAFRLAGDDITMFDPATRTVTAPPLPLTLKEGTWRLIGDAYRNAHPGKAALRKDGVTVRYLPLARPAESASMRVRAFVQLDRVEGALPGLLPTSKIDCLRKLFSESRVTSGRSSAIIMEALIASVDEAETLQLRYSDARDAVHLLEQHFAD